MFLLEIALLGVFVVVVLGFVLYCFFSMHVRITLHYNSSLRRKDTAEENKENNP